MELPCQKKTNFVLAAINKGPACFATQSSSYFRGTLSSAAAISAAMANWSSAQSNPLGSGPNAQCLFDALEWSSRFELSDAVWSLSAISGIARIRRLAVSQVRSLSTSRIGWRAATACRELICAIRSTRLFIEQRRASAASDFLLTF